ncbi:transposase [Streptomyces sp. CBMAI 2042]|uniref:transposase n=1 Tax=Streptomyces sp. CBMAI 2042 TaxID=2305222 RepID=UPI003FA6F39C
MRREPRPLTGRQEAVLAVIRVWLAERGRTVREIGARVGLSSTSFGGPPARPVRSAGADRADRPLVAGRVGPPRRRPEAVLGDKAYDSRGVFRELPKRRIMPVISRKGAPNFKDLGRLRYVVEQTFALLHQFKRLAVRWERRLELRDTSSRWRAALSAGGASRARLRSHQGRQRPVRGWRPLLAYSTMRFCAQSCSPRCRIRQLGRG